MASSAEHILQVLEEAGVEYVFGIPGGGTSQIFALMHGREDRIKPILVRHEQVAGIMADAYGRATGKPAAVMGQGLFIGSNASFGIMEAMLSSSPMLVVTDTSDGGAGQHPANQSGAGEYGSIDLPAIFRAMTKYTTLAASPKEAVIGTQLALKHATTGRPGPACVVMRSAAAGGEVDVESPPFLHHTAGYLNTAKPQSAPEDIARAVDILEASQRPVIVAGNGVHVSRSHELLRDLAEALGAPVATSYKGKSAIAETHPLSVGMAGVYGQAAANAVVGDADTVLVVGAKLSPQDTVRERPSVFDPRRQRIIQIDIDENNAGWTFPVELGLVGDAAKVMGQLLEETRSRGTTATPERAAWTASLPERRQSHGYYDEPAMHEESSPVTPQRLVSLLRATMPEDTVYALDAGNNRTWMAHIFQAVQPHTFFCPGGTAGMGWGLPAAVALKLVYRDRPVVCVTGDGGYMMTVNALSTAMQYDLPMICVVFNDGALGMVHQHQAVGKKIASEFYPTDNAAVARGFGAYGVQVRDSRDLPAALRDAMASGLPAVVDVIIDREQRPDDFRADVRRATET